MKTVWLIQDVWGYWSDDVFASKEAAVRFLEDTVDHESSWNYDTEHYIKVGDIALQEVQVIE